MPQRKPPCDLSRFVVESSHTVRTRYTKHHGRHAISAASLLRDTSVERPTPEAFGRRYAISAASLLREYPSGVLPGKSSLPLCDLSRFVVERCTCRCRARWGTRRRRYAISAASLLRDQCAGCSEPHETLPLCDLERLVLERVRIQWPGDDGPLCDLERFVLERCSGFSKWPPKA